MPDPTGPARPPQPTDAAAARVSRADDGARPADSSDPTRPLPHQSDGPTGHSETGPAASSAFSVAPAGLERGPLTVVGRLLDASNVAVLARLGHGSRYAIYKPVAGEQPLWDFPHGQLAYREVASFLIADAGGWDVIPPTVLRDGPLGPGSVQAWITGVPVQVRATETGEARGDAPGTVGTLGTEGAPPPPLGKAILGDEAGDAGEDVVRLFVPDAVPTGWLPAFAGALSHGAPVVVAHADTPRLRSLAVLDAVLNNSDRKGSHLLTGRDGRVWGIDHGVTLHEDDKLRTVLWGWAGDPLAAADVTRLHRLRAALEETPGHADAANAAAGAGRWAAADAGQWSAADAGASDLAAGTGPGALVEALDRLLTVVEVAALRDRVERLLLDGTHPQPSPGWPAIPWPPL